MIYLDNAATTYPKPEEVYKAADLAQRNSFNAGRGSYPEARKASEVISETREYLLKMFNAIGESCVLTPSATVAFNEIIGGMRLSEGNIVYVSPYEHNSVLRPLYLKANNCGIKIKELPLQNNLGIDIEKTRFLFAQDHPAAVFCTALSNVTGYMLPTAEIFKEAKKAGAIYTIMDASQAAGLLTVNKQKENADIVVFAGHKTLYGVFGTGGFITNGVSLDTYIAGGTGSDSLNLSMPERNPERYEPGSQNYPSIAALHASLCSLNIESHYQKVKELTDYLLVRLRNTAGVRVLGAENDVLGIVSITIDGYTSPEVGTILEKEGNIAVRTGYHCAGLIHKHLADIESAGTIRISVGMFNTKEDIEALIGCIETL